MGKNQGHKMRQMARHGGGGGTEAGGDSGVGADGMMDASFHSTAWHEARLASLQVGVHEPHMGGVLLHARVWGLWHLCADGHSTQHAPTPGCMDLDPPPPPPPPPPAARAHDLG
jgi:hypothetical protein